MNIALYHHKSEISLSNNWDIVNNNWDITTAYHHELVNKWDCKHQ